jgi:DNA replication protein DnaC
MSDCQKCDRSLGIDIFGEGRKLREPWCGDCRKKYPAEYKPLYDDWLRRNAETLLGQMGVPSRFQTCTLEGFVAKETDQRRVLRAVRSWVDDDETAGLFLCGPCGIGKTHLAVSVLLELKRRHLSGRFASAQELIMECRDCFHGDNNVSSILSRYSDADTLLLDDLGAEKSTDFVRETIGVLIDRIYRDDKLLIVTSNLDLNALAQKLDDRIADRLVEMCLAIKFTGGSYRHQIAATRAATRNQRVTQVVQ